MRNFRFKRLASVVAITTLAPLAGCQEPNQFQPPEPPTVTVARPLQQTVTEYLVETGTTEAVERVEIRARVEGVLQKVNFQAGVSVNEGDVLFEIDPREYAAKVAIAIAELESTKVVRGRSQTEYERQLELDKEKATSEFDVVLAKAQRDGAEAAIAAAEASLDQAELDLEYTKVVAPISGRVGAELVKAGNLVGGAEATHLTTVIEYDPIYANFSISERNLLRLREMADDTDNKATRKLGARPDVKFYLRRANDVGFPYEGSFDYADLAVDQSTGTYRLRGVFPNANFDILPGLFVEIQVPLQERLNALLLPESAIAADLVGRYVLIVNSENKVERRNVTLGSKQGSMVVVEEGITPDDSVIIEGLLRTRPDATVKTESRTLPPLEIRGSSTTDTTGPAATDENST
jgi:RND family efflux transporter MFP subunit